MYLEVRYCSCFQGQEYMLKLNLSQHGREVLKVRKQNGNLNSYVSMKTGRKDDVI